MDKREGQSLKDSTESQRHSIIGWPVGSNYIICTWWLDVPWINGLVLWTIWVFIIHTRTLPFLIVLLQNSFIENNTKILKILSSRKLTGSIRDNVGEEVKVKSRNKGNSGNPGTGTNGQTLETVWPRWVSSTDFLTLCQPLKIQSPRETSNWLCSEKHACPLAFKAEGRMTPDVLTWATWRQCHLLRGGELVRSRLNLGLLLRDLNTVVG